MYCISLNHSIKGLIDNTTHGCDSFVRKRLHKNVQLNKTLTSADTVRIQCHDTTTFPFGVKRQFEVSTLEEANPAQHHITDSRRGVSPTGRAGTIRRVPTCVKDLNTHVTQFKPTITMHMYRINLT